MTKSKVILHYITGLGIGGAEKMLCKLLAQWQKGNDRHVIVSLTCLDSLASEIVAMGYTVESIGMKRGVITPRAMLKIRSLASNYAPDIVIGWMYHGNLAASFCGSSAPVVWNIVHSLSDIENEKWLTRIVIQMCAKVSPGADAVIYNSSVAKLQHENSGYSPKNSVVLPNGFDPEEYYPSKKHYLSVRKELGLPSDSRFIGLVGRYHSVKNHHGFLEACQKIQSKMGNVYFVMIGAGTEFNNEGLLRIVRGFGLEKHVLLLGERSDTARLFSSLDILVSFSWGEGFSNVIAEAMLSGVPAVVSDVGDSALVVGNAGIVVSPGDVSRLSEACVSLLAMATEKRNELGLKSRRSIIERFQIDKVAVRFSKIFDEAHAGS